MNSGFINRLVGTTIVVIAAIVFIPNILDGEKVKFKEGFKTIPDRPEFKTVDLNLEEAQSSLESKLPDNAVKLTNDIAIDVKAEPKLADLSNIKTETSIVDNKKPIVEKNDTVKKSSLKDEKTQNIKRADTSNLTDFAYVIQLGSFSHKANVATLLAKLKKAGFTTFTKPVYTPSGKLTKVFVGPEIKKIALEAKLPKLKALTGLNGKVTIFDVTK